MFRIITILILSLLCSFNCTSLAADDGALLTRFDYCAGYGMELLFNDVNDDLVLLYTFAIYEHQTSGDVIKTSLRTIYLKRGGDGEYSPVKERTVFETPRQIQQLNWTYDPASKRFLVALLNGELYGDARDIRFVQLKLNGRRAGSAEMLISGNMQLNFPTICAVPAGTVGAPSQARYLFIGRGWDPTQSSGDNAGLVSVFLSDKGAPLGSPVYCVKEVAQNNKRPTHEPHALVPSGDNGGFLLACKRRESSSSDFLPSVLRLTGGAKYSKRVTVGAGEPCFNSLRIQQISENRFVVAWADRATLRFWSAVVPGALNTTGAAKLVSEEPNCTSDFDDPYPIFCKPDSGKNTMLFFAGDKSDPTVSSVLMKRTGKTKNQQTLALWDAAIEPQYAFDRWFAVAPIKGTKDFFCAAVLRGDMLDIVGYTISGK